MKITGTDFFYLKPLDMTDKELLLKWNRNPNLKKYIGGVFSASEIEHNKWFEQKSTSLSEKMWVIYDEENCMSIGVAGLKNIDWINRNAEFYIFIGEENYLDKGLGSKVTKKILNVAFLQLNLHKIYLYVFKNNTRAIKSYINIGFIEEGRLKDSIFMDGKYCDKIIMAAFREVIE